MNASRNNSVVDNLWSEAVQSKYNDEGLFNQHILEQYKIYVEMADHISERRDKTNTFFLTLHSLLLAVLGFGFEKMPVIQPKWIVAFPTVFILCLCGIWYLIILSYRNLNTAKYKVIGEFERRLPASPYYAAEWKALGEGKNMKLYIPLTHIEQYIPVVFALLYIFIMIAYIICK